MACARLREVARRNVTLLFFIVQICQGDAENTCTQKKGVRQEVCVLSEGGGGTCLFRRISFNHILCACQSIGIHPQPRATTAPGRAHTLPRMRVEKAANQTSAADSFPHRFFSSSPSSFLFIYRLALSGVAVPEGAAIELQGNGG